MNIPNDKLLPLFSNKRFWAVTLIAAIIASTLGYFFTGEKFIQPTFTSETIFFVPLTLLSKHIEQQGIGFAEEVEIDAHIQILKSRALGDSLLNKFPILHSQSRNPHQEVEKILQVTRTRYGSVMVRVTHHEPQMACDIANSIVELGDQIKEAILYKNRLEMFTYYRDMYQALEEESQLLEHQLDSLRENQLTESSAFFKINSLFAGVVSNLNHYKSQYAKQKKGLETPLPQSYVISEAVPAHKPTSPKRLLITFISGVLTVLVCVLWASTQN
jgi:uncharacterized protein involved in exopolysaccharide biosynthesis